MRSNALDIIMIGGSALSIYVHVFVEDTTALAYTS